jgi:virulence factor
MATRRWRAAVIGAGHIALTYHLPSLVTFPELALEAVADLVPRQTELARERFGIPRAYADYRTMLREVDPEVVYVFVRPQDLFEPAAACLAERRALFVEKPLGITTWQARRLAALAERAGVATMVGFQRRHVPALRALLARLQARGPVWGATVSFLKCLPADEPAGLYGGAVDALTSDGIHAVDLLRFLCGGEPARVAADVRRRRLPPPFPDSHTALVTFSSGAVGVLAFHYIAGRRVFRAEAHGPGATLCVDPDRESSFVADNGEPEVRASASYDTWGGAPGGRPEHWLGFWHEHRHFLDCLAWGQPPTSHFGDAVRSMELAERILREGGS